LGPSAKYPGPRRSMNESGNEWASTLNPTIVGSTRMFTQQLLCLCCAAAFLAGAPHYKLASISGHFLSGIATATWTKAVLIGTGSETTRVKLRIQDTVNRVLIGLVTKAFAMCNRISFIAKVFLALTCIVSWKAFLRRFTSLKTWVFLCFF